MLLRDFRTDWKHWSPAERIVAVAAGIGIAGLLVGRVYFLHG